MRPLAPLLLLVTPLLACAAPPLAPEEITDRSLVVIHRAFERTVRRAREDPDVTWHSGWFGNAAVHLSGPARRGFCYEWQGLVYGGVLGAVRRVGWAAAGITTNRHTVFEHHAVVVYDPRRLDRDALLAAPPEAPAYVLDAWRRGEPDVYRLADWLDLPWLDLVPPGLETPYAGR